MKESEYKHIIFAVRSLSKSSCAGMAADIELRDSPKKLEVCLSRSLDRTHTSFVTLMDILQDVSSANDPKYVAFLTALRYQATETAPAIIPVCTLANDLLPGIARTKEETVRLLDQATKSIYILGYWLTSNVDYLIRALERASGRGVKIILLADSKENFLNPFLKMWDKQYPIPSIYVFLASQNRKDGLDGAKMHAKTIIVDDERMLITSANLTYLALTQNIEVGIIIEGRLSVQAVSKMVNHLIHSADVFEKIIV